MRQRTVPPKNHLQLNIGANLGTSFSATTPHSEKQVGASKEKVDPKAPLQNLVKHYEAILNPPVEGSQHETSHRFLNTAD